MNPIIVSPIETVESSFTQYELPPEGISLLGYVVRRMHKTQLLENIPNLIGAGKSDQALFDIAHYTAAASVTFGKLHYEPRQDQLGANRTEKDPRTGAMVTAVLESISPQTSLACAVELPYGASFYGRESSTDSDVSLRGWVHSTTCNFNFYLQKPDYTATIQGDIFREVVPRLAGPWHIRAHGTLELHDNQGNVGRLILRRDATSTVILTDAAENLRQQNIVLI